MAELDWCEERLRRLALAEEAAGIECWKNAFVTAYLAGRRLDEAPSSSFSCGSYPEQQSMAGLQRDRLEFLFKLDIVDIEKHARELYESSTPAAKLVLEECLARRQLMLQKYENEIGRMRKMGRAATLAVKSFRELCKDEAGFTPTRGTVLLGSLAEESPPRANDSDESRMLIPPDSNTSISTWATSSTTSSHSLSFSEASESEDVSRNESEVMVTPGDCYETSTKEAPAQPPAPQTTHDDSTGALMIKAEPQTPAARTRGGKQPLPEGTCVRCPPECGVQKVTTHYAYPLCPPCAKAYTQASRAYLSKLDNHTPHHPRIVCAVCSFEKIWVPLGFAAYSAQNNN
ncbi:unnamed protein product, partial [Mesorhabditis spiculigera]